MGRPLKGKSGAKSLKAALQRHQTHDQLAQQYRKKAENKLKKKSQPSTKVKKNQEMQKLMQSNFVPFEKNQTLLLIGEGDMSYAKSIIEEGYVVPENLIVTSYDNSISELELKYPHSFHENYHYLLGQNVKLFFKIDAKNLTKSFKLSKKTPWNKVLGPTWKNKILQNILFNFPHTGKGIKDQDRNVADHQELVLGYLRSCKELFELVNKPIMTNLSNYNQGYDIKESQNNQEITSEGYGKFLLTVFTGEPYDSWMIKTLAKSIGLCVQRSGKFHWDLYPSYQHRRTNSEQDTTKPAKERDARVYVFEKFERKKKKNQASDEDD
ncbi:hypothetical protein HG535_0D02100 [Zygotorulaspora mrakii]|uniref:25S rRNA (uridine-N(3))-methyltransferase BMT5-like domain-containing protein n=1 Tax=Zygotorulaspora mrakii TaxID=42260 RepID=A0A7H9B431_ZYGMR|nr:uncharacterized protein HG535_0D02100 [Zygotorulaspora mrakii]QLG72502.1 hypothetical protein HG535_0D02100 [Zygotorulaspora mrakii]